MKRVQQGFTLIELMIVVAIIGILAAVALPAYNDYVTKSKWAGNVAEVEGIKNAIKGCLNDNGGTSGGGACDTVAELQAYGFAGSALPTPKNGTQVALTGDATGVKVAFSGSGVPGSFAGQCIVNDGGNFECRKTAGDTGLDKYVKGDYR